MEGTIEGYEVGNSYTALSMTAARTLLERRRDASLLHALRSGQGSA